MGIVARIVYGQYLDAEKNILIGGAQNYLRNLIGVLKQEGISSILYQYSDNEFDIEKDDYRVIGVKGATKPSHIIKYINNHEHDYANDILIFGTDFLITKNRFARQVAIQHGVAWDITSDKQASTFQNYIAIVKNMFRSLKKCSRYNQCRTMVCVDYNFVNWYRTQVRHWNGNYYVIPNFADVSEEILGDRDQQSIVFARRFVEYRGTKLFVNAVLPLLEKYDDLKIVIAGNGPDEGWMKEKTARYANVEYTMFNAEDSIRFHSKYAIAVIPTKGSEGTSLSLLEAMAAGCAVIVTNVGGMTNIVLDGFNGLIVSPDEKSVENAMERLITDSNLREFLGKNARQTVINSFSREKWCENWKKVIKDLQNS